MSDTERLLPRGMKHIAQIFCGCATPENTWYPILAELERLEREEFKHEDDLASAIVDHTGLSAHGGSIRGGWLTVAGVEALAFLREYGIDWGDKGPFVDDDGCHWGYAAMGGDKP